MLIRIDPAAATPLFEQLAAAIRADVVRGSTVAGDRLPAARELAESLDVNLHTVLRAYQALRDEGLLDLRRGRGAIVTAKAREYAALATELPRLIDLARTLGVGPAALAALIREDYRS